MRKYWAFLDDKKRMLDGENYAQFKQEVIDRFQNYKDMSKMAFILAINDGKDEYDISNEDEFRKVVHKIGHDSSHQMKVKPVAQENFPDPVLPPEMLDALEPIVKTCIDETEPFVFDQAVKPDPARVLGQKKEVGKSRYDGCLINN